MISSPRSGLQHFARAVSRLSTPLTIIASSPNPINFRTAFMPVLSRVSLRVSGSSSPNFSGPRNFATTFRGSVFPYPTDAKRSSDRPRPYSFAIRFNSTSLFTNFLTGIRNFSASFSSSLRPISIDSSRCDIDIQCRMRLRARDVTA